MNEHQYTWLENCLRDVGEYQESSRHRIDVKSSDLKGRVNLVTEVDRESEERIVEAIRDEHPADGILAEEELREQTNNNRRWIIDPLDGTTNYVHSHPLYGISVGLEVDGKIQLGMAYFPELDDFYRAVRGDGSYKNDRELQVSRTKNPLDSFLATGFADLREEDLEKRYNVRIFPEILQKVQGIRRGGSAVHDLCLVAEGVFDGFWEFNLEPWDVAAGSLIIREAGGTVSDMREGSNWLTEKNIVASNGPLHETLIEWLQPYLPGDFPSALQ